MKLIYQEDPGKWRQSVLLTALGLAIVSSLLRWRHVLPNPAWLTLLGLLGPIAIGATLRPRWFRGWYRLSLWLGFYSSQFIGRCVLALFFIFIITPLGLVLRWMGKDPLQLKRQHKASYWQTPRNESPLDRLF